MFSRFFQYSSLIRLGVLTFLIFSLGAFRCNVEAVYINRFNTTDNGGIVFTGNTLGLSKQTNLNQPGSEDAIGAFITTDTSKQVGSYLPGTVLNWRENNSYAILDLPSGSTVLYAELVWSGSYGFQGQITGNEPDTSITMITPDNVSHTIAIDPLTAQEAITPGYSNSGNYVRSANVTSIVQAAGGGKYTVGGVAATIGALDNTHNAAGWTLAVVYHDGTMSTKNLSIFVGCEQASNSLNAPAQVTGFCAPPSGALTGTLFVSAIEGDANKSGDRMLFGSTSSLTPASNSLSGVNNPINNFFGSQINTLFPYPSTSAMLDTRGSFGNYNSNPFTGSIPAGSRQGYDITAVDISSQLVYNQTTAYALGTTSSDDYTINALGLQISVGAPSLAGTKQVNGVTAVTAELNDVVTYTFSFTNNGTSDADNVVFKDLLETGLSYVPGTFLFNGVLQPDPNLTTGFSVGSVPVDATITFEFKAKVVGYPSVGSLIFDTANLNYSFQTCIEGQVINLVADTNEVVINLPSLEVPNIVANKLVNGALSISSYLGSTVTFEIDLTNNGNGDALNVVLTDLLPTGLSLVPDSVLVDNVVVSPDPDLSAGFLVAQDIAVGQTIQVIFQAIINSYPISGNTYTNSAHIAYQYQKFYNEFVDMATDTNVVYINLLDSPVDFIGKLSKCRFFDRKDYCLNITWQPVFGAEPIGYEIFHNGVFVAFVPASGPYEYKTCFKHKSSAQGYEIRAVYSNNVLSSPTQLVIKNG